MKQFLLVLLTTLNLSLAGPAAAHDHKAGDLRIDHPWARATAPGQKAGGAFMKIANPGREADRLLSARSDIAERVELHTMSMDGNVMRMREVEAIDIPAGGSAELKPGGLHVMLRELKAPLKAGERVALTLRFERAGEVTVELAVEAVRGSAPAPAGGHSHH